MSENNGQKVQITEVRLSEGAYRGTWLEHDIEVSIPRSPHYLMLHADVRCKGFAMCIVHVDAAGKVAIETTDGQEVQITGTQLGEGEYHGTWCGQDIELPKVTLHVDIGSKGHMACVVRVDAAGEVTIETTGPATPPWLQEMAAETSGH